jgi:CBS domain-containing membrane protein
MVARDIMTKEVVTIREAADLLAGLAYDALPVVNEANQVIGVVSYRDLIRLALPDYLDDVDLSFLPPSAQFFPKAGGVPIGEVKVGSFMRKDYFPQMAPDEPVAEVARIMITEDVRRVVVVEGGKLLGIISRGDVVRAIVHPAIGKEPGQES